MNDKPCLVPESLDAILSREAEAALVRVGPVLQRTAPRFADLLKASRREAPLLAAFETKAVIGRPLGSPAFVADLERRLGRPLAPAKRGRKPKALVGSTAQ